MLVVRMLQVLRQLHLCFDTCNVASGRVRSVHLQRLVVFRRLAHLVPIMYHFELNLVSILRL